MEDIEVESSIGTEDAQHHEGIEKILELIHEGQVFESPIDIDLPRTTALDLPPLEWHNIDLAPKKVKFTNSGHTTIFSAKWNQERPYISGGPFMGNYVFSQLHFHWGANNMEGSEHTVSGVKQILEMHVVFFKSCYLTQESALKRKDGIAVLVYLFKLQDEVNEQLQILVDAVQSIQQPHSSTRLKNYTLDKYLLPFHDDYFLYVGSVNTTTCLHYVLWLICRVPLGVAVAQVESFRSLIGVNEAPLLKNFRDVQPLNDRIIYHINASGQQHSTLLIMAKKHDPARNRLNQIKYPRSSKEYINPTGTTI